MAVFVRPAEKKDLPALGRMGTGLVHFHHALDQQRFMVPAGDDDLEGGYRWWLEKEMGDKKALVLVAEVDAEVIGYAYGRFEGRDWGKLLDRRGELIDIWVDEKARRTGAGRALCEAIIEGFRAKKIHQVVLYAASENPRAQAMFKSIGFRPTMVEMTLDLPKAAKK